MSENPSLQELRDLLDDRRLVVLTGPGISSLPPTSIPDPRGIAEAVLAALARVKPGLSRYVDRLQGLAPNPHLVLGLLFQGLSEVFLEIFVPLVRRPPNRVHRLLALLVAEGRFQMVIEAQRDGCLERALRQTGRVWGRDFSVFAGEDSYSQYSGEGDRPMPYIFKILGAYERAPSLREDLLEISLLPKSARGQAVGAILDRFVPLVLGAAPDDFKGNLVSQRLSIPDERGPRRYWVAGPGVAARWQGIGRMESAGEDLVAVLEDLCRHAGIEPPAPEVQAAPPLDYASFLDDWLAEQEDAIEPHYLLGSVFAYLDHDADALECLVEGSRTAERDGDNLLIGAYQMQIGTLHFKGERWRDAVGAFQRALNEFKREDDRENLVRARNNLATSWLKLGNEKKALEIFQENQRALRIEVDHTEFARTHEGLAAIHANRSEWQAAIEDYAKSLAAYHEIGDIASICRIQDRIGAAYFELGKFDLSASCFSACLKVYREMGLASEIARSHLSLARAQRALGDAPRAIENAREAVRRFEEVGRESEKEEAERLVREILAS